MRAGDLRASVERRGDATVVRLGGVLDVDTCPSLRSAVLACLATEPAVIVLDVADLRHRDDVTLTVLPTLAQYAAAWPGSTVSLAAASPPLASALDRMAVARLVPLFPTTDAALAHRPGAGFHRLRLTLAPMVDATAAARHLIDRACRLWGVTQATDLAELVVTELVSNVVRHARTEMEVGVALHRRLLHVSVRDHSPALPHPGATNDTLREDGRGLLVVGALTDGWGCTPVPDGKVVWATLRIAG